MKQKIDSFVAVRVALALILGVLLLAACADDSPPQTADATAAATMPENGAAQAEPAASPVAESGDAAAPAGYPGPAADAGYPGADTAVAGDPAYPPPPLPEGLQAEPPNPERTIPQPDAALGAVGGVLIRDYNGEGFLPVTPKALFLGEVLVDSQGRQALVAQNDQSHRAQLFPTGVFVFNNIPPGTYGLVIDIGISQFLLSNEDGSELLIDVEAGSALDMGQIRVTIPGG